VGNIIASSQAFFVTAVSAGTVDAVNGDRTTDVNPTFFSYTSVPNLLRMEVNGMGSADESVVYFDPSSVSSFDAATDGIKILSTVPGVASLYTLVDNHKVSINVMGDLNQDYSIPLGVRIQAAGTYDIKATDLTSMAPTAMVYLEDLVTGTMQNLRQNAVYTINLAANDYTNRFVLHFHPAVVFNGNGETCAGNDGSIAVNYPSGSTVNVTVKNSAGVVVSTLNNFNGTSSISNLASGNYTVGVEFAGGFTSTDYVQVAAGNAVTANMTASTQSVDLNSNAPVIFTATANGATSYNWNFGDGTVLTNGPANVSHLFTTAGVYDVTFEATNSICSGVSHASVTVLSPTGIVSNNVEGVKVFGVENRVSVQFGSLADGKGRIEVLNMLGQSLVDVEVNTTKGTKEIEVPGNAVGHYMVRVTTANKVYTQKVYLTK
jgi:PKD repeat protein